MRFGAGVERDHLAFVPQRDAFGELAHVGAKREVGAVDAVELIGIGVDVDQLLARMIGGDQRVAVGGRLAEPRADHQQQVGCLDPFYQLGIWPVAEVAGADRRGGRQRVLPAEGSRYRQADPFGEMSEVFARLGIPTRAADDCNRRGGVRQQRHHRRQRIGAGRLRGPVHERPRRGLDAGFVEHVLG